MPPVIHHHQRNRRRAIPYFSKPPPENADPADQKGEPRGTPALCSQSRIGTFFNAGCIRHVSKCMKGRGLALIENRRESSKSRFVPLPPLIPPYFLASAG